MKNFLNKLYSSAILKKHTITIGDANIFITVVIFLFTLLFAYLLIVENYQDYERALLEEQRAYDAHERVDSEVQHKRNQQKLKSLLIKNTMAIATLSFILFAIVFGIYKIFNSLLKRDLEVFLDFFKEAAHSDKQLNPEKIFFKELYSMVPYANNMVETITDQKRSLQELNLGLEEKVALKTQKLLQINKTLLEEQKMKDEILKAQKEFLRYTVHETNTPLSVILTNIELHQMQHPKDRYLSKIEVAVKNIFSIYDDLSYLVKKDQVEYPKAVIDLEAFVRSRIDFFEEVAQMSKLSFEYEVLSEKSFVYINETKLQRIVDNTLTNAIKYTLPEKTIFVRLQSRATSLDLSVGSCSKQIQDTDKIFEAYYREEDRVEGFGLGLGLVKSICKQEGIVVRVETENGKNVFSYEFKMMGE
ncbi:MAG: HAMP domain-containing sensor histidine kinase [Sulfurimonas sp.]|jgi:signal transduction histidine kinase|nr:HAMP domain-containing sensor histidine kinase [Sulfurimonas sp.]